MKRTDFGNSDSKEDPIITSPVISISNKFVYSCYYEVRLDEAHFGKRREEHFKLCNEKLKAQLIKLENEGIQLCQEASNSYLIDQITKFKNQPPGEGILTWEHCPSSTANGRLGVMRLVPRSQHTKNSQHWKALHPDYNDQGGYHEWALPAGASVDGKPPISKDINIKNLTFEQLPYYFEIAVSSNRVDHFSELLSRAKMVCPIKNRNALFTQCYPMGKKQQPNSLLHIAVKNGNCKIIREILNLGIRIQDVFHIQNHRGNTILHIAAENNRHNILRELRAKGADLTIKNKRNETVADIVYKRGYKSCFPYCQPKSPGDEHESDEEQGGVTEPYRDPFFAYAWSASGGNDKSSSVDRAKSFYGQKHVSSQKNHDPATFVQPSRKTFRDLINKHAKPKDDASSVSKPSNKKGTSATNANAASQKTYAEIVRANLQKRGASSNSSMENIIGQVPRKTFREIMNYKEKKVADPSGLNAKEGKKSNFTTATNKATKTFVEIIGNNAKLRAPMPSVSNPANEKKAGSGAPTVGATRKVIISEKEKQAIINAQRLQRENKLLQFGQERFKQKIPLFFTQQKLPEKQQQVKQQVHQKAQQRSQQQAQQQAQQRVQQQAQQKTQQRSQQLAQQQAQQRLQQHVQQKNQQRLHQQTQLQAQQRSQRLAHQEVQQRKQQQLQQKARHVSQQQSQQGSQQQVQQQNQQQTQQRSQQHTQQQTQWQSQQRSQQQSQLLSQQKSQQQTQQQVQHRSQQQAQQLAYQRALQQAQQQRTQQQQAQQRAQQLAQQQAQQHRAQQLAQQQRSQQQAQQRVQQQVQQQRSQQQQAQQRAQQQSQQQRVQLQQAQQRAQQQQAQRAQQLAQQQRLQQQQAQQRIQQQQAQQRAQQLAQQQRLQQQQAQQRAQQQQAQQRAQQLAQQRIQQQQAQQRAQQQQAQQQRAQQLATQRAQQLAQQKAQEQQRVQAQQRAQEQQRAAQASQRAQEQQRVAAQIRAQAQQRAAAAQQRAQDQQRAAAQQRAQAQQRAASYQRK